MLRERGKVKASVKICGAAFASPAGSIAAAATVAAAGV